MIRKDELIVNRRWSIRISMIFEESIVDNDCVACCVCLIMNIYNHSQTLQLHNRNPIQSNELGIGIIFRI